MCISVYRNSEKMELMTVMMMSSDTCRASDQVRRDPTTVTEMHDISMFLATHNVILTQVKTGLSRITGYEDVLCSIIKTCICWYEQKQYLLPEEKYNIVKV